MSLGTLRLSTEQRNKKKKNFIQDAGSKQKTIVGLINTSTLFSFFHFSCVWCYEFLYVCICGCGGLRYMLGTILHCSSTYTLRQGSQPNPASLACQHAVEILPLPSRARLTGGLPCPRDNGFWWSQLWGSCLHGKCFNPSTISLAYILTLYCLSLPQKPVQVLVKHLPCARLSSSVESEMNKA